MMLKWKEEKETAPRLDLVDVLISEQGQLCEEDSLLTV